jgi:hypothetical protein
METDFQKQLQALAGAGGGDLEENAIKYLSLAIMYTLTEKAGKLSLKKEDDRVKVVIKGDSKITLASPAVEMFDKIVEIIRAILHIEEDKGELPLALGLRSGDLELQVKVKRKSQKEAVKMKFPAL